MDNLKNTVTNIVGIVVGVGTAVATALGHVPADAKWYVWTGAAAIVSPPVDSAQFYRSKTYHPFYHSSFGSL